MIGKSLTKPQMVQVNSDPPISPSSLGLYHIARSEYGGTSISLGLVISPHSGFDDDCLQNCPHGRPDYETFDQNGFRSAPLALDMTE